MKDMKVKEYIEKKGLPFPEKGKCPMMLYIGDAILYKMSVECCESSMRGDCIRHFLSAELGDIM